ncbi:NirD/YgiW/YdeI family stress tolerance protein [Acinetobacter puyangensis]|uniref:NirD/YgiW/YdeI family stress tolerance protein n=1 Tax=Acinetobacter puyangensis TaxID=1096779 RepID=UPI003A4DDE78
MKNMLLPLFTASALMMGTATVSAAPLNQQALTPTTVTSVKQAHQLKDDSKVLLKGQVVKSLGDEKYEFRDSTGTIKVEIDDELWGGRALSPTQTVTLLGEIDIDYKPTKRVEVDVDEVRF